jgi:hypothetical protein
LNPGKLGKIANHSQEAWKAPLPVYNAELYLKRFNREEPEKVRSMEEVDQARRAKRTARSVRTG